MWHWSGAAGQTTGFAPTQVPAWQVSVWVQASASSQVVPSAAALGVEQRPVAVSQVPMVWHWSAVQITGSAPTQAPASQVSVCVQALPSLQALPSAFTGLEQAPVAVSQVPGV